MDEVESSFSSCSSSLGPPKPEDLLEWLIPVAYDQQQAEFTHRRHPGTLQWFLDSDAYQKWIHAHSDAELDVQTQDLRTLFCPGSEGAGKTILTSAVVQDLGHRFQQGANSNVGIAYLYCFYDCQGQQSTTNLLLALLEQLLLNSPRSSPPTRLSDPTQNRFANPPSLVEIAEAFKEVIARYDRVFLVIDALDECASEVRTQLLKQIKRLQTDKRVHLFATSNSDSDFNHMFANAPSLEIQADPEDVRSYLELGMDELPAFVKRGPALKEEVEGTIIKAVPGSFLAPALQLKFLATMSPSEDPRTALEDVARDWVSDHYDALFEALMRRIENQAPDKATLARKTLSYMACARSPWTAAELCQALTVKVGDTQLDSNAMPSLQAIMAACSGMMVAIGSEERDEHDETMNLDKDGDSDEAAVARLDRIAVRLVHRTAHEYLQRTSERWLPEKDKLMATSCMAHLSLHYFSDGSCSQKSDLELRLRIVPLYYYAALHWEFHVRVALGKFPDLASIEFEFLGSIALIEAACCLMWMAEQWPRDDEDKFGDFPRGMNGLHITAYFGITNLVCALGKDAGAMVNAVDEWGFTPLAWAAKKGHEETVKAILKFTAIDVDIRDNRGRTPISLAAISGHTAIVEMLLDHGSNQNFKDFRQETPLSHAVKGGHTTTVALLIRCGVDSNVVSTEDKLVHTPLSLAVIHGHDEIISLLLSQPNIQPRAKFGPSGMSLYTPCTALGLAVSGCHFNVVERFLANPDIAAAARTGEDGEMLLHLAVWKGHEEMVRLLLSIDINANTQCDKGDTPLHIATYRSHRAGDGIARLLLSQPDVMPDLVNTAGNTPALLAASRGRIEILRLLLEKGVDTEARNKGGLTLLGVAAKNRCLPVVELLLATDGVDADSRDAVGCTPLALAAITTREDGFDPDTECVQDNSGVIQCLLNSGRVDINSRDDSGQTPLMHATQDHHDDFPSFKMLLNYEGVDLDAMDNGGETALSQAVITDEQDKAILLLEKGADPNLVRLDKGETLLSHAAGHGMVELVRALISHGRVDVQERNADGHTALCRAAAGNKVQVLELLLGVEGVDINARCDHGQTPLHHAAEARKGEEVASLLLAKGNPDLEVQDMGGRTPLHCASQLGSEALVSLLLDEGVANANCRDLEGRTPLSLAAQRGQLQIINKLMSLKGVIADARDKTGRTPLSWAVQSALTDASAVVKRLLNTEGVDPDAEDEKGWTPLSWAVQGNKASDLVDALLVEGGKRIDINHEDRKGRTPLALALKRGHEVVVGQLRAVGAREEWLHEYPVSLFNGEHEKQGGIDISHVEPDGPVCGKDAESPRESDIRLQPAFSEDDFLTDSLEKDHWQRERSRWLSPNWFDDTRADTDSNESDWSGTSDGNYDSITWSPIETQIKLGAQDHVPSGDEGKDVEGLCLRCKTLDLDQLFSRCPPGGFRAIVNLGDIDQSWESRPCAMCRLLAAVRPRGGTEDCELCAYSSTAWWLSRGLPSVMNYFMSNWVDTMIVGIEYGTSRFNSFSKKHPSRNVMASWRANEDILPHGFISRVGSNDRYRLRSLTVHQLQADQVDFERARGWIDCCAAYHGRRCNPSTRRPTTSFRLIDCMTRDIVDGYSAIDPFVALSYVWGSSTREPATVDHVRAENAERVVEDAIQVTQALGYRYLWVDRHCITNEDEEIRRKQLLEMNAVYANAQVTIVAAAGEDSSFGLPGVSRPRQQPCARIQGHTLVAVPPEPSKVVKDSVWWTRGWTFQEGVLSRRRLIFTEHEVSYECRGMVARESVEKPGRVHRIAATRYPIHNDLTLFSRRGDHKYHGPSFSIWSHISEYTERYLTHDHDILNAMLGIMEAAAERKNPVYHLCGVPIVPGSPYTTYRPTLLERFLKSLCWKVSSGTRREGFPSWSWTGWKGKASSPVVLLVSFDLDFPIEVSMVPRDDQSRTVSWAEFEAMGPKEKAALPQNYVLEITGVAADVSIRYKKVETSYVILYNGDDVLRGSVTLCKDPERDASFLRRLAEERLRAVVIGHDAGIYHGPWILLALVKVGDFWERIGVIHLQSEPVLDVHGGGCRRQTFLIR